MNLKAEQVGMFVLAVIFLLPSINIIIGWARHRGAVERTVKFPPEYATTDQLGELEDRIDMVDTEVRAMKESIVENGETRREKIEAKVEEARAETRRAAEELHKEIAQVSRNVAALESETRLLNQNLMKFEGNERRLSH